MLLLLVACSLVPSSTGDTTPLGGDDSGEGNSGGGDSDGGDTGTSEDPAVDDARVRALTDLPEGRDPCAEPLLVRVAYTVDGDTFYATPDGGGDQVKVRMIGVNTPEIEHETAEECFGNEAWTYTAHQLENRLAWLTFDGDCFDDYGRTLAYVIRDTTTDGFYNRNLARNGYAYQMTISPNDTFEDEIADDVAAAEEAGLGLWGACP
jgi:micrococcal nuclease